MTLDRRSFLRRAGVGAAAAGAVAAGFSPAASAQSSIPQIPGLPPLPNLLPGGGAGLPITNAGNSGVLGTVIDYSGGVPSGGAVRNAGHLGAVRYCSNRRPGAEWMRGKPLLRGEADDFRANGLTVTSCYQFGKGDTSDWRAGAGGGDFHAPIGIGIHFQAGGPAGAAMYVAIDDNPTRWEFDNLIAPYLDRWNAHLAGAGLVLGVYANAPTIDWCVQRGLGRFFWQHDWGSGGRINPATTIHQVAGWEQNIGGIACDVNNVYSLNYGQWGAGGGAAGKPVFEIPAIPGLPPIPPTDLGSVAVR